MERPFQTSIDCDIILEEMKWELGSLELFNKKLIFFFTIKLLSC